MLSKHLSLLRARNKRDIALKADAEAAMEKLAAGFEKTESGLRYQFIQRRSKL
jgi:peptidyl-prolyl cis-trans isomerase A (cyclophilin A)